MSTVGPPGRHVLGSWTWALAVRPVLWVTAARVAVRLLPNGWWRHWPPRPLPPPDYLRFRSMTSSGTSAAGHADEVVRYLEWCRHNRSALR